MAPCWSARGAFASLDLLCTVEVKHLIFIITSNFISSELNTNGGRPKKTTKAIFYQFGWKSLSSFLHFLLFLLLMPGSSCRKF